MKLLLQTIQRSVSTKGLAVSAAELGSILSRQPAKFLDKPFATLDCLKAGSSVLDTAGPVTRHLAPREFKERQLGKSQAEAKEDYASPEENNFHRARENEELREFCKNKVVAARNGRPRMISRPDATVALEKRTFADYPFDRDLVGKLEENNLLYPTAVQSGIFREWFKHSHDLLIKAQTGTGKTLGFVTLLYNDCLGQLGGPQKIGKLSPKHIVIVPNSILAEQLMRWIDLLHANPDSTVASMCFADELPPKAPILISSGKRLLALLSSGDLSCSELQSVLIDEADSILDPLRTYSTLQQKKNRSKHPIPAQLFLQQVSAMQKVRFVYCSATINALFKNHLKFNRLVKPGAVLVEASDKDTAQLMGSCWECPASLQHLHRVFSGAKLEDVCSVVAHEIVPKEPGKGLIIVPNDMSKEKLARLLESFRVDCQLVSDPVRGTGKVLMGSDTEIRGLDIADLEFVIIVGLPDSLAHYVHMAGRVGRMGRPGRVYTLLQSQTALMRHLSGLSSKLRVTSVPLEH